MKKLLGTVAAAAVMTIATQAHAARDYVWAAGSSTVFPFSTRVAENYARKTGAKAPKVESLGTGGGFKAFCGGTGEGFPDIANASRPMKKSEFDACAAKGVKDIIALKIGLDGIVIATDKDGADYNFKLENLYLGLSAKVLRYGKFVPNPYGSWDDVGTGLPGNRIMVYGPPPTSGTRDAFTELAMEKGGEKDATLAALKKSDEDAFKAKSHTIRSDGAWIDSGENDNAIVQTLEKTPHSLGVFGYSFLENNMDKVKAAKIEGVAPTFETISNGTYPLSRSLFIYVKKANIGVTPGLREFVDGFVSDAATGKGGYLQSRGLIPLPEADHAAQKAAVKDLTVITAPKS